jgi:sortase B
MKKRSENRGICLMKKGMTRQIMIFLLVLLTAFASACNPGGGIDVDIDVPDRTDAPSTQTQAPQGTEPSASATPIPQSENVDPSNTIDPNELDGTDEVADEEKLSYDEYRAINSDVIGWITIDNTNVDYPVVRSHDNIDYLTQNAKKEASKAGAIFMDYRCSANDSHVIIYGHNMSKSKIMFAQVTNYSNRSFYDANRTFEVTFGDKTYTYKVFSVYSVDVNDADYMAVDENFPSGASFVDYMNNTLAKLSIFPVDTTIGEDDHVLTLSTCTHTNYANGRFVVHAVRVG